MTKPYIVISIVQAAITVISRIALNNTRMPGGLFTLVLLVPGLVGMAAFVLVYTNRNKTPDSLLSAILIGLTFLAQPFVVIFLLVLFAL